jgi:hypothetical protein
MAANSDTHPIHTIRSVDPPPASDQPTSAMLFDAHYSWDSDRVGFIGLIVMTAVVLLLGIWIGVR